MCAILCGERHRTFSMIFQLKSIKMKSMCVKSADE